MDSSAPAQSPVPCPTSRPCRGRIEAQPSAEFVRRLQSGSLIAGCVRRCAVRHFDFSRAVSSPPVPVVCAVIERDGLVLLAQRPPHKLLPLKWEFAGGKVEPGEAAADAIVREIREELGCAIRLTRALPPFVHDYGRVVIEMIPFVCAIETGSLEPHPHEHVAIAWVKLDDLTRYDLAAADYPVIAAYRASR
ncbi:MAG: 8-oxo-dGTP diphosphatase MutT [Opitutus sp.]|nr:8-oxo-dGTP diphosphatase MutT [Opitutus sp.]